MTEQEEVHALLVRLLALLDDRKAWVTHLTVCSNPGPVDVQRRLSVTWLEPVEPG